MRAAAPSRASAFEPPDRTSGMSTHSSVTMRGQMLHDSQYQGICFETAPQPDADDHGTHAYELGSNAPLLSPQCSKWWQERCKAARRTCVARNAPVAEQERCRLAELLRADPPPSHHKLARTWRVLEQACDPTTDRGQACSVAIESQTVTTPCKICTAVDAFRTIARMIKYESERNTIAQTSDGIRASGSTIGRAPGTGQAQRRQCEISSWDDVRQTLCDIRAFASQDTGLPMDFGMALGAMMVQAEAQAIRCTRNV